MCCINSVFGNIDIQKNEAVLHEMFSRLYCTVDQKSEGTFLRS